MAKYRKVNLSELVRLRDWFGSKENTAINRNNYRNMRNAIEEITALREELGNLQEELGNWPRVYWYSSEPKSLEEGYRVMSVSGKTTYDENLKEDVWLDVYVDNLDYDGELFAAPDDFGLYSSTEAAEAARKDKTEAE